MAKVERNPNGNDGFCRYCGKTGLPPNATACDDDDCIISDHVYKECGNHDCRNLLGPVAPESRDKYCSTECASESL